jgi:oxalate decarboxylase/phosphoglucose isomerase-like protein (cupin superfamily)
MPRRDQLSKPTEPTLIRLADVPYVVWGDAESGFVSDRFYLLSEQMILVTVILPPGGRFRSSDKYRPYFDTHECLYVLQGQYTCQDPETGETHTAGQGEMIFMPERRWHYGYNFGAGDLHLLECIAPPTNQAALAHVERPSSITFLDKAAVADLPLGSAAGARNLKVAARETGVDAVIGMGNPVLMRIFASTARVCFAAVRLNANSRSDILAWPFDLCYYAEDGTANLQATAAGAYFNLEPGDVVFLPAGTQHRLFNHSGAPIDLLLGGAGNMAGLSLTAG